jgi:hypothetical protein
MHAQPSGDDPTAPEGVTADRQGDAPPEDTRNDSEGVTADRPGSASPEDMRNAAEDLRARMGLPPLSDEAREANRRQSRLQEVPDECYRCEKPLGPGGEVWRVRIYVGRGFFGDSFLILPHCPECGAKAAGSWRARRAKPWPCEACGRPVVDTGYLPPDHTACGSPCREEARKVRRRAQHDEQACATCGKPFTPTRADAAYCSSACRQRAYRERKGVTGVHPRPPGAPPRRRRAVTPEAADRGS